MTSKISHAALAGHARVFEGVRHPKPSKSGHGRWSSDKAVPAADNQACQAGMA